MYIYLAPGDAWVGYLSEDAATDGVRLHVGNDATCTFPAIGAEGVLLTPPQAEHESFPIDPQTGYIELFEVGQVSEQIISNIRDCEEIEQAWATGSWSTQPGNGIKDPLDSICVDAVIVNPIQGTSLSIPTVSLANFRSDPSHVEVDAEFPTLADAQLGESQLAEPLSERPIDFVSNLMLLGAASSPFFADTALNGQARVLFFAPTRRFYRQEDGSYDDPFEFGPESNSDICAQMVETIYDRDGGLSERIRQVCAASFITPPIAGEGLPENGTLRYQSFGHGFFIDGPGSSSITLFGFPVVPYLLQTYVNGDLNGVRANFATIRKIPTRARGQANFRQ